MTGPNFRVKIVAVTAAAPTARSVSERGGRGAYMISQHM